PPSLSPVEIAEYLSNLKLSAIPMDQYPENSIFIGCDTIVVLGQTIMGKPANEKEAFEIISQLSGRKHNVITGVTVARKNRKITSHRTTIVSFKEFTSEEIDYYIKRYKPYDKAGGYGIQEWIGFIGIDYIEGSFYNVMGFPTKLVYDMLTEIIRE
ncbi:MAG TPA: Maf family protein, partial [Bacteroidales bacterium]|nr:Maf family protein [Bacteroidales bacterium]